MVKSCRTWFLNPKQKRQIQEEGRAKLHQDESDGDDEGNYEKVEKKTFKKSKKKKTH